MAMYFYLFIYFFHISDMSFRRSYEPPSPPLAISTRFLFSTSLLYLSPFLFSFSSQLSSFPFPFSTISSSVLVTPPFPSLSHPFSLYPSPFLHPQPYSPPLYTLHPLRSSESISSRDEINSSF